MVAVLYALICLIWGSTWLAIKVGLVGMPPFLGAGLRFLLSAMVMGLVVAARRRRWELTRDDKVCVLSLGLLVFWLDYACVYWAELHISSRGRAWSGRAATCWRCSICRSSAP